MAPRWATTEPGSTSTASSSTRTARTTTRSRSARPARSTSSAASIAASTSGSRTATRLAAPSSSSGAPTFAAIHASPPCQANTALTKGNRARGWKDDHVDLIPETRELLDAVGLPYVIENVQGATMRRDLTLCGETFGLGVIRHRYFELGRWSTEAPEHAPHRGRVAGYRHGQWYEGPYFAVYGNGGGKGSVEQWQTAMGIDWLDDRVLLAEAIPPAYTEFVGARLLKAVTA